MNMYVVLKSQNCTDAARLVDEGDLDAEDLAKYESPDYEVHGGTVAELRELVELYRSHTNRGQRLDTHKLRVADAIEDAIKFSD
jgi:hypothetical protein